MRYGKMYLNGKNTVKYVDLFGIELGNKFIDNSKEFKDDIMENTIRCIPNGIFIRSSALEDTFILGQITKVNNDDTINVRLVYSNLIVNDMINRYTDCLKDGVLKGLLKYELDENKNVYSVNSLVLYTENVIALNKKIS